jgi:hypothetical protein
MHRRLTTVDRVGMTFTAISAVLAIVVVLVWALESAG